MDLLTTVHFLFVTDQVVCINCFKLLILNLHNFFEIPNDYDKSE